MKASAAELKFKTTSFDVFCRDSAGGSAVRTVNGATLGQYGIELWSPGDCRRIYRLIHIPSGMEIFTHEKRGPVRSLVFICHEHAPEVLKAVTLGAPELHDPVGASEADNAVLRAKRELYGADLKFLAKVVTAFRLALPSFAPGPVVYLPLEGRIVFSGGKPRGIG